MGRKRHNRKEKDHGFYWGVLTSLYNGPKSEEELKEYFAVLGRRVGLYMELHMAREDRAESFNRNLREALEKLRTDGLIEESDGRYSLTESGSKQAEIPYREVHRGQQIFKQIIAPTTVSTVTLVVHFVLAALKIPAGILSGSIGLINDAVDTLLDGVSSLLVFFGFRFHREREVNILLVVFMLGTGAYTLFRAIQRFFVPYIPEVDVFTFIAALVSAGACGLLWVYQRFSGLRNNSFTLVTQSVDSRNHVIVAIGVTTGLIASKYNWPLLDTLVGLAVSVLILKSAIELLVELIRSRGEDDIDLTRYAFGVFEKLRKNQLCSWLLHLIERGEIDTRKGLSARAEEALEFNGYEIQVIEEFGFKGPDKALADKCIDLLFEKGWLVDEDGKAAITAEGKKYLHHRIR